MRLSEEDRETIYAGLLCKDKLVHALAVITCSVLCRFYVGANEGGEQIVEFGKFCINVETDVDCWRVIQTKPEDGKYRVLFASEKYKEKCDEQEWTAADSVGNAADAETSGTPSKP